jgi:hypothetical protein
MVTPPNVSCFLDTQFRFHLDEFLLFCHVETLTDYFGSFLWNNGVVINTSLDQKHLFTLFVGMFVLQGKTPLISLLKLTL